LTRAATISYSPAAISDAALSATPIPYSAARDILPSLIGSATKLFA
jgi:hypothetical protein